MGCYCKQIKVESTSEGNLPEGYCGICEICGKLGHTRAHSRLATTSAWCDKHWDDLNNYKIITLADIFTSLFVMLTIAYGIFVVRMYVL